MPRELQVAGASGVVARAVPRHFEGREDWRVAGLSRRLLDVPGTVRVLPLDLRDPAPCEASVAGPLSSIKHLVYRATAEKPNLLAGWLDPDHADVNEAMPRNLLEVKAWIVPEGERQDEKELIGWCLRSLAPFKVPRFIAFVEDFPRSATKREVERAKVRAWPPDGQWDREAMLGRGFTTLDDTPH